MSNHFNFFFKKALVSLFFLLSMSSIVFTQNRYVLKIQLDKKDSVENFKNITFEKTYTDSLAIFFALQNWQKKQQEQGFLESNIDKIIKKDSVLTAFLHIGNRYEWIKLGKGNLQQWELEKIGFREKSFYHKTLNYKELSAWFQKILRYQENNGFPFASVFLSEVEVKKNGEVSAELQLKKGKKIFFDKIVLEDDSTKMSVQYLARFLDILPKMPFDKSKITAIKNRIRELPFLELDGEPFLSFDIEKANIHLVLKRKPASRFDALLGVLPENSTTLTDIRRFIVTGTLNLDLWNALNKGERFQVDFQRFKANQQQLKVETILPYIAKTPLGVDASLDIYRRDVSFTTTQFQIGGRYMFRANDFVKIYWQGTQNNLTGFDTLAVKNTKRLPENLDIDAYAYGLELQKQRLDYRFNPRKGWSVVTNISAGTRNIRKNNRIAELKNSEEPNFNYASLYDTVQLRSLRWQGSLGGEFYIPIFQRSTIKLALRGDGIFTEKPIFQNEQYRMGGNRSLRGFDEDAVFATRFLFSNAEYRFLIGQNSFFSVFSDFAYVENSTAKNKKYETYLGFGAGMNFETRAGIFSLNYALGKKNENPIDLRAGKIHFGYINIF